MTITSSGGDVTLLSKIKSCQHHVLCCKGTSPQKETYRILLRNQVVNELDLCKWDGCGIWSSCLVWPNVLVMNNRRTSSKIILSRF